MTRKKTTTDLASCDTDRLRVLADTGNSEALEALRKQFQDKPELAQQFSNLAYAAQEGRLQQMIGKTAQGTALLVREQMRDMATRVAGDKPTPLERLLAERVVMCWLDVRDHEHRYASLGADTFAMYEWRSRMLDRAHNRYLSAIIALAKIRKLSLPTVQVNIADKQINTTGGVVAADRNQPLP